MIELEPDALSWNLVGVCHIPEASWVWAPSLSRSYLEREQVILQNLIIPWKALLQEFFERAGCSILGQVSEVLNVI